MVPHLSTGVSVLGDAGVNAGGKTANQREVHGEQINEVMGKASEKQGMCACGDLQQLIVQQVQRWRMRAEKLFGRGGRRRRKVWQCIAKLLRPLLHQQQTSVGIVVEVTRVRRTGSRFHKCGPRVLYGTACIPFSPLATHLRTRQPMLRESHLK